MLRSSHGTSRFCRLLVTVTEVNVCSFQWYYSYSDGILNLIHYQTLSDCYLWIGPIFSRATFQHDALNQG